MVRPASVRFNNRFLLTLMIVVQKLVKSYDQKFGARSIIHEIQHVAVNVLADAHVRGDLKYQ